MLQLQLLHATTSPFVRKVMVCAYLSGLADKIELLPSAANPIRRDERIAVHNPLAKVPTLILPDGQALYDSRVICEYLASVGGNAHLFPASGPLRWQALTQQSLGDGLLDAALLARYELSARPAEKQSPAWREAQLVKVGASLDVIEAQAPTLVEQDPTIGDVTIACALGYLDFRYADMNWRTGRPQAARWFEAFRTLPAMHATIPYDA